VNTLQWAKLGVPVLVQASDDDLDKLGTAQRRDAFCGKLSVCNNLRQYGIPFTDTATHTVPIDHPAFAQDIEFFAAVCRVVNGLRSARIGAVGARPAAFQTMRASEKLLQASGLTVVPVDLSELFAAARQMDVKSARGRKKLAEMKAYGTVAPGIPNLESKFEAHVRFSLALEDWLQANAIDAAGIQCWTSIQQNLGCAACLTMSMMSDGLRPCACEVDVAGVTAMYALVLASGNAAAIVDWNNNYGNDPDKGVVFHCSNLPKDIFVDETIAADDIPTMDYQAIIAGTVGKENTYGTVVGRVRAAPFTYCRVSTDDLKGKINTYLGEGELTNDPLKTFGGFGVVRVPNLQKLLRHICENGFEHHVAINLSQTADAVNEALGKYLGWDVYYHNPPAN